MSSNFPIGIFDSGVGGLSVLRHIRESLPHEHLIYVADRRHIPYGNKSDNAIKARAQIISHFLLKQQTKAIVVACNTATAAAVSLLRDQFPIPIIGMEPGVKPAIHHSKNGNIGVLATEGTLDSGKFRILLERHANGVDLFIKPCHGWVEWIESGQLSGPASLPLIQQTLDPLLERDIDTLVLGCTHYPFLKESIQQVAGAGVNIIDTGLAVAAQLRRRLEEEALLNDSLSPAGERFWCTGPLDEMQQLLNRMWETKAQVDVMPDQANLS
ncbi:MAG: glutamate racemase [Candidatus Thiodiazotropha sp. (ex Myrtea sp. 'scaly one' KF741663)]|nr:glutamate racemase [Candidatus Thiodiazotropha sp. (ex Myrtea sp. 'scaly one' KF741663)]